MTVHLVLGGARSGKSRHAEQLVLSATQDRAHYIATAVAFDSEMKDRIDLHQQRRDKRWINHESQLELADYLCQFTRQDVVLVDCLTVWLNNVLFEISKGEDDNLDQHCANEVSRYVDALAASLDKCPARVVVVSNEVGMGVVPMGKLTRFYVDHAGWMNQKVAAIADHVTLVSAGLPLTLK